MKKNNKRNNAQVAALRDTNGNKQMKPGKERLHPSRIDLPEKTRTQVCDFLNESLAVSLDLKTQVKQAHWNVKGVHFYQLHLLFDEMAGELEEYIDMIAERITTLAGTAFGTIRMAVKRSTLPEYPLNIDEGMDHVIALADRYALYAEHLRDNIEECDDLGDKDTADLYTEISRDIDKRLWFLEAHLQAATAQREAHSPVNAKVAARPKR